MVTVDKYIRKLLFEHDCVIIPEFGGLLTHHVGAHFDVANSVFLPARKRLAFNEVLKIDDGLLNYYVATNEKLPREEAANLVRGYVDTLRQQLSEGGSVTLDSIGVFSSNAEGKLVFEPDYTQNFNDSWYGLETQPVKQVDTQELPLENELETFESEVELVGSTEDSYQASTRSRSWLNWAAAAVFVGTITLLSTLSSSSENPSLLSTLNPFETVGDLRLYSQTQSSKATPVAPVVEPIKKQVPLEEVVYVPKNELAIATAPKVASPNKIETEAEQFVSKVPEVSHDVAKVNVERNHYFLIAGSFGRLKNARDLKNQLIRKGFSESNILEGESGRLIKVSAGSYVSMEMAMQNKNKVDEATGAESWVYHRR